MNRTISKIWSIGLVVILLASMLLSVAPASAGTLTFSQDTTTPSLTNKLLGPAGLDITDVAVNGNTVYAVGIAGAAMAMYKSTDGGYTWSDIVGNLVTVTTSSLVAVAPDNADVVVVVDAVAFTAAVSTNGGSSFSNLGTTTLTAAYDVDIAALSGSTRYVAIAGAVGAVPGLMYFNLGAAAPAWINAVNGAGWTALVFGAIDNFRAVKFSPNFPSDLTVTAVSEEIGAGLGLGVVRMHAASFNTKKWDATAGTFASYPVTITSAAAAATTYNVGAASISLDPAYLGGDDTTRIAMVGLQITDSVPNEVGGLFRLKDTTVLSLKATTGIKSVAWDGTNLVAGPTLTNVVYRSADALASTPTVSSATQYKRPGIDAAGNENVVVAWVGANVIAGSTGNNSGIYISKDNGKSFNGVALIDTVLGAIPDFAVSANGSIIYMLSFDAADISLWRYSNAMWQVVFTLDAAGGAAGNFIVRVAPTDANTVYLAKVGAFTDLYYATDAGENRWFTRASRYNIADLAVETKDIAYIGINAAATVSKTTNGGFTWGDAKATSLSGGFIATITSIATDKLLVGSTTGYVAYSTDGNANWTKIDKQLSTIGLTQVTATNLADKDYIYAVTSLANTNVDRWQIGVSTSWKDLADTAFVGAGAFGISLTKGVLYVLRSDGADSDIVRTMNPSADSPTWIAPASVGETFNTAPSALRVSTGSVKLWFINTLPATDELWSFTDTVADTGVTTTVPANNVISPLNPITGRSIDMAFTWTKPSDGVLTYAIRIYTDAAATQQVVNHAVASTDASVTVMVGPFQGVAATNTYEFAPGKTYYWRVRTATPVVSQWSEMRTFTIEPTAAEVPAILSPSNGADTSAVRPSFSWSPVAQGTEYQFVLALNPYLTAPIIDVKIATTAYRPLAQLEPGTTYYWAVKATKPVAGSFSAVANFTVAMPAEPAAPPVIITQVPAPTIIMPAQPTPPPAQTIIIPPAPTPPAPIAPAYIWAIIIIGAVLVLAVIVLIVRTRRTV